MSENNKYPDLVTKQPPNGFAKLEPVPREKSLAPMIAWGQEFLDWPDARKISYLKSLSSTMNHAADVLQTERNQLLELLVKKEALIKSQEQRFQAQSKMIDMQLNKMNTQKQELNQSIVDLKIRLSKIIKENKLDPRDW